MALQCTEELTPRSTAPLAAETPAASPAPYPPAPLVEVGFWADPRDPEDSRPRPAAMVDTEWGATVAARAVALYARSGFVESFELGYSFCRMGCGDGSSNGDDSAATRRPAGSKIMGCCTQTDGRYVWPEGLAHYISEHAVRPPDDFVDRALGNLRALRTEQVGGRLRWDAGERGNTVPLAPGTAVFLRDRTTLGIALPPEPEVKGRNLSPHVCSCVPS